MTTIKKKHNIVDERLILLINKYNNVVRYAYNRIIKDNITELSKLEQYVKTNMKHIDELDASWIKAAVKKATELDTEEKLYFGGKKQYFEHKYKKSTETYNRNIPLFIRGSSMDRGNRKAILKSNILTFKPNRNISFDIELKLSKNQTKLLNAIKQEISEGRNYFNIGIDETYVYISFNAPQLEDTKYREDRYLGIDLNPNWIAVSILDKGKSEVFKEIIDISGLNDKNVISTNKKRYELTQINKHIIKICKYYGVECVCVEDLNIKSKDLGKGKKLNKLINIDWNRNYMVNNLIKWCDVSGIKHTKINPFYSSFMGQLKNENDYDSVAASKEVCYRGYIENKGIEIKSYVKDYLSDLVATRWKNMLPNICTNKELYDYFKGQKKSTTSYRFLFTKVERLKYSCLRLNHHLSNVDLIRL